MDLLSLLAFLAAAAALVVGLLVLRELRSGASAPVDQALASTDAHLRELAARQAQDAGRLSASVDGTAQAVARVDARMDQLRQDVSGQLSVAASSMAAGQNALRQEMAGQMSALRLDTSHQLETVRATVDERLAKTLNDRLAVSFQSINEQLEAVNQGLGAVQGLASNVGDLRRVLTNVKTRGILGEVQLGAILQEVLAPEQYETNVAVKPGSRDVVEFAVRIPVEGGGAVLLPIDAKFPGDTYAALEEAREAGTKADVEAARKALVAVVKREAKDISSKYISVPETTNFALMFLPVEGLYAEVVSVPGLIVELQRDYSVNVAGPSTMAALLNSLQLSYQTLAIQRQTDTVLQVLQGVKAEFPRYQKALEQAKAQIERAGHTVDRIITTRARAMERKLRDIELPGEPHSPVLEDDALDGADD